MAGAARRELHNALMIGQGDIVSAEPARRIARMAALARADAAVLERLKAGDATLIGEESALGRELAAYLARFSDRCAEELKLESVTLDHNPAPLLAAVAASAGGPPAAERDRTPPTLAALLPGATLKRMAFRPALAYAKARVRDRENLRFERTRIFGHARHVFLAMGEQFAALGLIEEPRDILFLTVQETLGAIEGFGVDADLRALVALRRREAEVSARRPDPLDRVDLRGAAAAFTPSTSAAPQMTNSARERSATGCSAGVVRGVALAALPRKPGATYVSICSAGDNALNLPTLDPTRVVALDLSRAQIACLRLRMAAYEALPHGEFLVLMGARDALFDRVVAHLDGEDRALWTARRDDALAYGVGGVRKFERYFRLMRERLPPFVHSRATVDAAFEPRLDRAARQQFLDRRWNNWRWRMLLKLFFSRTAMGRLGRDPAFFDHVEGSVADHVARRVVHAAVDLDPSQNSYLR